MCNNPPTIVLHTLNPPATRCQPPRRPHKPDRQWQPPAKCVRAQRHAGRPDATRVRLHCCRFRYRRLRGGQSVNRKPKLERAVDWGGQKRELFVRHAHSGQLLTVFGDQLEIQNGAKRQILHGLVLLTHFNLGYNIYNLLIFRHG